jgi:hypothetical protein
MIKVYIPTNNKYPITAAMRLRVSYLDFCSVFIIAAFYISFLQLLFTTEQTFNVLYTYAK